MDGLSVGVGDGQVCAFEFLAAGRVNLGEPDVRDLRDDAFTDADEILVGGGAAGGVWVSGVSA